MKKSQSRNIITEQQTPNTRCVYLNFCDDSGWNGMGTAYGGYDINGQIFTSYCMTVNGGQVPQVGQVIELGDPPNWPWPGVVPNQNPFGNLFKIVQIGTSQLGSGPPAGQPGACSAIINGQSTPYISYDIPLSTSGCPNTPVLGCTDSNAFNFNSNATQDDGSCDYGWLCKDTWPEKPGIMKKCTPGNQNNPGTFETKPDCIESGCEPLPADKDFEKDITPFTMDPQSKMGNQEPIDPFDSEGGTGAPDLPMKPGPLKERNMYGKYQFDGSNLKWEDI
tara:strand:- start:2289 stop:3122 length:834 start_codon:yes stop_codon:yes gene_type:complete